MAYLKPWERPSHSKLLLTLCPLIPTMVVCSFCYGRSLLFPSNADQTTGCKCKSGWACNCCTSRKSALRLRRGTNNSGIRPTAADISTDASPQVPSNSSRTPSHILARLAELRPVLPRPMDGASHHPQSGFTHGHHSRHYSHENLLFSPYGRAYDLAHNEQQSYDQYRNRSVPNILIQDNVSMTTRPLPAEERTFRDQLRAVEAAAAFSAPSKRSIESTGGGGSVMGTAFPSTCGCGDSCTCPGCRQHNGAAPSSSAFSSCTNPGVCNTCLDCTILSLPASLPPDSSLSIFDAYQAESIDEWIREVSSLPRNSPPTGGASQQQEQQGAWDNYLSPIPEPSLSLDGRYRLQQCCGVLCKCSPETCECDLGREDGYDCRRETLAPASSIFATGDGTITTDTFDNIRPPMQNNSSGSGVVGNSYDPGLVRSQSAGVVYPGCGGSGSWGNRNYLAGPNLSPPIARSRSSSSSSSSRSSHQFDFTSEPHNFGGGSGGSGGGADSSADPFGAPPFTSFSLPDLGASLQSNFSSEMRSMMSASPPHSLRGGGGGENCAGTYPVSNPDSDGYSAELDAEESSMWDRRIHGQLQHPWPRTN